MGLLGDWLEEVAFDLFNPIFNGGEWNSSRDDDDSELIEQAMLCSRTHNSASTRSCNYDDDDDDDRKQDDDPPYEDDDSSAIHITDDGVMVDLQDSYSAEDAAAMIYLSQQ